MSARLGLARRVPIPITIASLLALAATGCNTCCPKPSPCCERGAGISSPAPTVAVAVAVAPAAPTAPAPAAGPDTWDALLRKYVRGDYVDYAAWKANPADLALLDSFLAWQGKADVKAMSESDQIAFYINAYNSTNIRMVLDHYPIHSPMDIPGYFDKIKHRVAGEDLTVSEVEYDRLIAQHKDMRAHFAVVCSDRGCLPIRAGAWRGATLDADLDAAARKFAHDPRHFKVDVEKKEVWISKIFEWYGKKFMDDPKRPAAKPELFVLPYVDDDARKLLESGDYTVKIIEWNWTLNEKRSM